MARAHDSRDVPATSEDRGIFTVRDAYDQLEVPEGYRAELIDGEIIVTPAPIPRHANNVSKLIRQFAIQCPECDPAAEVGIETPRGVLIPDLTIVPDGELDRAGENLAPDVVMLVVEVTSPSSVRRDRHLKREIYAMSGIPLYLLIDRTDKLVTLHSLPNERGYSQSRSVKFGDPLPLPEPFGFSLDTDRLV